MNQPETHSLLILGGIMFAIGLLGFLTRRSLILLFLSLETMLLGVSLNLIAFSRLHQNYQGQLLAIMVLTIAACEAAIALAMVVSLYRRKPTLDVEVWKGLGTQPSPSVQSAEVTDSSGIQDDAEFPKLVPAGLDPLTQPTPLSMSNILEPIEEGPHQAPASRKEFSQRD